MGQNAQRERLRRWLRDRGFGCLQKGEWDFERINRGYALHLKALEERPGGALRSGAVAKALRRWAAAEREAWLEALTLDPLLPGRISPSVYLRRKAWWRRVEVFRYAGRKLRAFGCV
jgi:hypothetical protein